MVLRIDKLTREQEARFDEWADRWIEVGLRNRPADRERFERAVEQCYGFAGLEWPGVVVWVPSPLVMAFAAPASAFAIELVEAERRRGAVGGAVRGAVDGAVRGAVRGAVDEAVNEAVRGAVRGSWYRYLGGQFWAGGWYWGGAWTSFFRDVCDLELDGDLWDRARAYEATIESACWWWPHRRFVMVSERPLEISRELADPGVPRGWGSHRLHREDGPAVVWPDGWGVWAWHGVRVPQRVIEQPDTLSPAEILGESNAEVRRVMMERFGPDRLLRETDAELVDDDGEFGKLWRLPVDGDEDLVMVEVVNSTLEPDGSAKDYWLRVPPGVGSAREAVAWTFDVPADLYQPTVQT